MTREPITPEALRRDGLLASDSAVARVVERFGAPGSGDNARVLDVSVATGLRFDVLTDRGFDIGHADFAGWPMSWRSPVADARPLSTPDGDRWLDRFTGGLLVTCGLRSFGRREDAPLHGDVSHRPASAVRVTPSRGRAKARLEADVEDESIFGPALRLERKIEAGVDDRGAWIEVSDDIVNTGRSPVAPALLYHLNFGAPLMLPGTYVHLSGAAADCEMVGRDAFSASFPFGVVPEPTDEVVEAVGVKRGATIASVRSPAGFSVEIEASDTLPWMHQWVLPTRGRWALGIEPATASLLDEDARPGADEGSLAAGDRRSYAIRLTFSTSDPSRDSC